MHLAISKAGASAHSVRPSRTVSNIATPKHTCAAQRTIDARHTRVCLKANADQTYQSYEEPEMAKEAIDLGIRFCNDRKWEQALPIFEKALSLPGTGLKRFRDKPRLISDGEKQAALYNIACCHANLGDPQSGLVALSGCLELGYQDFAQIRNDPDLAAIREDPRFGVLLQRFEPKNQGGFFGGLFGGKN